jgi:hypothetical protein
MGKRSEVAITDGEKKKGKIRVSGIEVRASKEVIHLIQPLYAR